MILRNMTWVMLKVKSDSKDFTDEDERKKINVCQVDLIGIVKHLIWLVSGYLSGKLGNILTLLVSAYFFPAVYRGGASEAQTLFFELLGSQMTHWNEPILYGKVLSWGFQKVQDHFGGRSESWAIRDQKRSILSRKTPHFWGGENHDLKNSYFIFYKFNQGPVFCKHPNF